MADDNNDEGLGWFGWLIITGVLALFNLSVLYIIYLAIRSTGILDTPTTRWQDIQTQVVSSMLSATPGGPPPQPAVFTRKATPTPTPFIPPSPTPTQTPLPFPTRDPRATAAFTPSDNLPLAHYIEGVVGHQHGLPLSFEAGTAVDWAAFFKVPIMELEFQNKMPLSDNPEAGFVGDVNDTWGQIPPYSYGVHAPPVAAALKTYGINARVKRNMTLDELRREIAQGRPVIVWVKGNMEPGEGIIHTTYDGKQVVVTPYMHSVIAIGYDMTAGTITVVNDGTEETYPLSTFMRSWVILGNMAIVKQ